MILSYQLHYQKTLSAIYKGLNFSAKNSPRRLPARSPSELTPFSFSEDSLKILATDIERQNGKIPMHLPLRSGSTPSTPCPGRTNYSQPRTPNSEFGPPINYSAPLGTPPSAPPRHLPLGSSLSCGSFTPALGGGSLGTPGRSIRDLEESFKDIKKENFSLKIRIFYLEERMGRNFGEHDIINSNINLKVQVENLRQEMQEKDELLQEATNTLDILDQKLRNSERKHEQEMAELLDRYVENPQPKFELGSPRKSMKSPDVYRKLTSPAGGRKLFNYDEFVNKDDRLVLGILEEKDEVLENPGLEVLLQQNQLTIQRMQSQLKHKEEEIQVLTNSECSNFYSLHK
ncbi:CDK5 regulatory subunit-associated protein 2, partial [Eurytemora carolleeae]|uniref:CDK5 regulatory subunit-associated protein 2 n=1 Tax=Eurytemora carolleeae TaxID=1294199 RepID=UPI000C7686D0